LEMYGMTCRDATFMQTSVGEVGWGQSNAYTIGGSQYPRVIRPKTYCGFMKLQTILNAIYLYI